MRQLLTPILLWFAILGCGLLAGVYFAFSTFIMASLARIPPAAGMAAMNAINVEIVRSPFMPFFFGTTLASVALAALALFRWGEPGAAAIVAGGLVYLLGMFAVTVICNVPLNDALLAADPSGTEASIWGHYVQDWTFWNHVRTLASLAATALFTVALVRQ